MILLNSNGMHLTNTCTFLKQKKRNLLELYRYIGLLNQIAPMILIYRYGYNKNVNNQNICSCLSMPNYYKKIRYYVKQLANTGRQTLIADARHWLRHMVHIIIFSVF